MNPRNTLLLLALAAGLFGFIWLIEPRLKPPPPVAPRIMPGFKPAEVTSVEIRPKGQFPIHVDRTNGTWLMTQPLPYPVRPAVVDNFLGALADLAPHTEISADELRKLPDFSAEYGFDAPEAAILLEIGGDKRRLLLGSRTPQGDELYTQLVGTDSVDVIGADFLKFVPRRADDWRDPAFVKLAGLDYDRLAVAHSNQTLELALNATNQLWRLTRPAAARADNIKIKTLLDNLQNLRVNTFVTDTPADLDQYGLQPPQAELTFGQGTNRLFSLQLGKSPTNDNSLVYARSNAQNTVVLLPRDLLAGWWDNPDAFRERHLLDIAADPPDLIEVSGTNVESFTVQLINGVWGVSNAHNQAYLADPALMRNFLDNLARLQVADQNGHYAIREVANPAYLNDYGLAPVPGRAYTLKHTSLPASTNEVDFGLATNNGCILAKRADENPVVAVPAELVNPLPSGPLDLRQRQIWAFDAADVARITIRKGKSQIWDHKAPNKWELADVAGNNGMDTGSASVGIEQAAQNLGILRVQRWVERGDTNRAKYDIDDNHPKISLEVKRGEVSKTLSIDFGRATEAGIYASVPVLEGQNWTNWIVVFPERDADNLVSWLPGLR